MSRGGDHLGLLPWLLTAPRSCVCGPCAASWIDTGSLSFLSPLGSRSHRQLLSCLLSCRAPSVFLRRSYALQSRYNANCPFLTFLQHHCFFLQPWGFHAWTASSRFGRIFYSNRWINVFLSLKWKALVSCPSSVGTSTPMCRSSVSPHSCSRSSLLFLDQCITMHFRCWKTYLSRKTCQSLSHRTTWSSFRASTNFFSIVLSFAFTSWLLINIRTSTGPRTNPATLHARATRRVARHLTWRGRFMTHSVRRAAILLLTV